MKREYAFAYLLFLLVGLGIFYPVLRSYFVSDDFIWLEKGSKVSELNILNTDSFAFQKGRPGTLLLFSGFWRLFTTNSTAFHSVVLFFHSLNAFIFFVILRRLGVALHLSLFASIVFLVHFAHEETLFWISALSAVFCLFFILTTVYFYVKWLKRKSITSGLLVIVCSILAMTVREDAIVIPLVLLVIHYVRQEIKLGTPKSNYLAIIKENLFFFLPSILFSLYRLYAANSDSMGYQFTLNPAVWIKNSLYCMINLLIPVRLVFDKVGYNVQETLKSVVLFSDNAGLFIIVTSLLLISCLYIIIRFWNRISDHMKIGATLTFLAFLPYITLNGNGQRFLYFPLIGGSILLVKQITSISKVFDRSNSNRIAGLLICIFCLVSLMVIQERSKWWIEAGQIAKDVVAETNQLAKNTLPGEKIYIANLPSRLNGAYIFHLGFNEAISLLSPDIKDRVIYLGNVDQVGLTTYKGITIYSYQDGKMRKIKSSLGQLP